MTQVAIAESFTDALKKLDVSDAKRAISFLAKLVRDPAAPGFRPRIVHDAADRTIRSINVTHDLRAIAHADGERIVVLHVARHDRAYVWARERCIACHDQTGEVFLVSAPGDLAGSPVELRICSTVGDVCRYLDEKGVAHDLRQEM